MILSIIIIVVCLFLYRHYRRYGRFLRFKYNNAFKPLEIPTYDGGNQGLHPSCLYFKDGWNGHKYWFVFTPYKEMDESLENPCIYYSDNGIDFSPVEKAYPLDNITLTAQEEYNSDPELVYNSSLNRIECWWRRVYTDNYPEKEKINTEIIYRSFSYDGISWSDKESILEYKNRTADTRALISPSLIYEDGLYRMWVSHAIENSSTRVIDYFEMKNNQDMHLVSEIYLENATISHLDVFKFKDTFYLLGFDVSKKGFPYMLYSSKTPDGNFLYEGVALLPGRKGHWDDGRLYRPSITIVNDALWLYYSAYQGYPANHNHVGLIKLDSLNILTKYIVKL